MSPALRVDAVTEDRALRGLRPDWDRLLAKTPMASAFQSLPWIEACRAVDADAPLRTLVVRDGAEVLGILPTELARGGRLRFVGDGVSNYGGPVYDPARASELVAACAGFVRAERDVALLDFAGLREGSPFLAAVQRQDLLGWSDPTELETAVCPYVDLTPGWDALYARRKGKRRANFTRAWHALERLGRLGYVEVTRAADAVPRLPALFELFAGRWRDRHESGGFASRRRRFHERAIVALAEAGALRLSLLELDGRVIAFVYGVWGAAGTISYVIGHDDRLNAFSPGSLLLLRVLESACRRGDREFDFSVGVETYKDRWATESRRVYRVLRWRDHSRGAVLGRAAVAGTRAWTAARSVPWLRDLRREGLGRRLRGASGPPPLPDTPGLAAGGGPPDGAWHVYRVPAATGEAPPPRPLSFDEMGRRLSPRLLALAVDRAFRGDTLLASFRGERLVGVVWRPGPTRVSLATGGLDVAEGVPVLYHPVAASEQELTALLASLLGAPETVIAAPRLLPLPVSPVRSFVADLRLQVDAER